MPVGHQVPVQGLSNKASALFPAISVSGERSGSLPSYLKDLTDERGGGGYTGKFSEAAHINPSLLLMSCPDSFTVLQNDKRARKWPNLLFKG